MLHIPPDLTSDATKRAALRFVGLFLSFGAGDAVIQFLSGSTYDWRHLGAGLAAAAIMAVEQYVKTPLATVPVAATPQPPVA